MTFENNINRCDKYTAFIRLLAALDCNFVSRTYA